MSPSKKRQAVKHVQGALGVSERRACKVLKQPRSTQRYAPMLADKDRPILKRIHHFAQVHPRFGYRRVTALLRREGWMVNRKRVERLWRKEGLQVSQKRKKRLAPGHSAQGCAIRRAREPNDVWTYDFVFDATMDGKSLKLMPVVDEFTRQVLSIMVARSINAEEVAREISRLVATHGAPNGIRSDNGGEFIAHSLMKHFKTQGIQTLHVAPGSPWENGYCESFNSRFRDELLNREIFGNLLEAQVLIERHRRFHNEGRPHSALDYLTPDEFAAGLKTEESAQIWALQTTSKRLGLT